MILFFWPRYVREFFYARKVLQHAYYHDGDGGEKNKDKQSDD